MAINATSSPCLRCGISPGRPHIAGCPLDELLEAVAPAAGRGASSAPPVYPTGTPQADSLTRALSVLSR